MPRPSSDMYGGHYRLGPRKAVGFWALLREMFGWRDRWKDDAFSYHENIVTGDRKAIPRNGVTARDAQPDHKWLESVR